MKYIVNNNFCQVGEIRPATVDDFKQLLDIVFSHDGWEAKPNKGSFTSLTHSLTFTALPIKRGKGSPKISIWMILIGKFNGFYQHSLSK